MADRDEFGPHLRSARLQRGISIAQISQATKVGPDLWEALERNDLSRWPGGIFARSNVRAYAIHVGLDPEATVDEFCRCFPAGDRRAGRGVREHAALLAHETNWRDDLGNVDADRRAPEPTPGGSAPAIFARGGRPLAVLGDIAAVALLATLVAALFHLQWTTAAAFCALVYNAAGVLALGSTPSVWAIDTYLSSRRPSDRRGVFLKLLKSSNPQILKSSN